MFRPLLPIVRLHGLGIEIRVLRKSFDEFGEVARLEPHKRREHRQQDQQSADQPRHPAHGRTFHQRVGHHGEHTGGRDGDQIRPDARRHTTTRIRQTVAISRSRQHAAHMARRKPIAVVSCSRSVTCGLSATAPPTAVVSLSSR